MDSLRPGRHISGIHISGNHISGNHISVNRISVSSASTAASSHDSFNSQELEQFKNQVQHQVVVLQRWYQELKTSSGIEKRKTQELMQEITVIKELMKPFSDKMSSLQKFVAKITDENAKLKRAIENQDIVVKKMEEETEQEINTLKGGIASFTNAVEETRGMAGSAAAEIAVPPNFPQIVNVLEQQMGSYDMKLAETDLRFQVLETTNYNGRLVWKIRDFNRRKDDAERGGAISIYSQPFYTSKYGYKMCLRIYLNGDGMGKNTHISLFFVLMKGEYDAVLPFPFKQKVSLFLLDQSSDRRHLTDVCRPEPASSSFEKPNSDMNIASGCPMFVSHDQMRHGKYNVDDTIFIRAVIDTTDLENY